MVNAKGVLPCGNKKTAIVSKSAIADELIRLEVVDYITDSTVCEVMKKTKLSHGLSKNIAYPKRALNL